VYHFYASHIFASLVRLVLSFDFFSTPYEGTLPKVAFTKSILVLLPNRYMVKLNPD
jgi:hypothetical protein